MPPVEVQRKLTVLGYPGVGKSSLTTCFVENRFVENYDPTIENTFHKTIRFRNAHFVTDIVDTAGMVRGSLDEWWRRRRDALTPPARP